MSSELLTYADVPKDRAANLLWRAFIWEKLQTEPGMDALVVASCEADALFYVNTFCWTLDPRLEEPVIPFITYDYQDKLILKVLENVELSKRRKNFARRYDLGVDKSRDMGVTWCLMYCIDWLYRFKEKNRMFRCISRKEDLVDNPDDQDALFQKLDFLEERLPTCIQIRGDVREASTGRIRLKLSNAKKNVAIKGESSNENAGRGGRSLLALRDEEAFADNGMKITTALVHTTRVQVRVSTPNGVGNSFHLARANGKIDWLTFHWSQHPVKSQGLYSVEGGRVTVLDKEWHKQNPGYEFVIGPTYADPGVAWEFLRSPYFDEECRVADSVLDIAQELQISYLGSGAPFFASDQLASVAALRKQEPVEQGSLFDLMPVKFMEIAGARRKVVDDDFRPNRAKGWFAFASGRLPPQETTYTVAVDISAGTGASDSVISVADDSLQRKVFEFKTNRVGPESLAVIAMGVVKWFTTPRGTAFLSFDQGGHGLPFGNAIKQLGATCLHYYKAKREKNPKARKSAGVPSNRHIKNELMSDFRAALFEGRYQSPSEELYQQAEQFIFDGQGGVVHQKSKTTTNSSDTGEQHGDIVTCEAILWLAMRERPAPMAPKRVIPVGSFAWRLMQQRDKEREEYSMFTAGA